MKRRLLHNLSIVLTLTIVTGCNPLGSLFDGGMTKEQRKYERRYERGQRKLNRLVKKFPELTNAFDTTITLDTTIAGWEKVGEINLDSLTDEELDSVVNRIYEVLGYSADAEPEVLMGAPPPRVASPRITADAAAEVRDILRRITWQELLPDTFKFDTNGVAFSMWQFRNKLNWTLDVSEQSISLSTNVQTPTIEFVEKWRDRPMLETKWFWVMAAIVAFLALILAGLIVLRFK